MNKVQILFSDREIIKGGAHLFSNQDTLEFIEVGWIDILDIISSMSKTQMITPVMIW